MRRLFTRRRILIGTLAPLAVAAAVCGRPASLWFRAWLHDAPVVETLPPGFVDDASRLNRTAVAEVWPIPSEPAAAETQLRELLARARRDGLPVSIAGARHSMGGHTIAAGGIVIDMRPFRSMELIEDDAVLRVGAGARWADVLPVLDARGLSVAVMQSNNDFTVGGSLSANCHGWQSGRPPIASTVRAFRLMTADGRIVRCSREEHAELFSLALGGYGLFGVILDAELRVVPNAVYRPEVEILPADDYADRLAEKTRDATDVGMAYGRLCVVPGEETFLRTAILTIFREVPPGPQGVPPLEPIGYEPLLRAVYRAQIDSPAGKAWRWEAETRLAGRFAARTYTRNQLLDTGAATFRERNADRTDILHEYFVPPSQANAFLTRARAILPRHDADLLNLTVRSVQTDDDTVLRYADRELLAFVMLFNQPRNAATDAAMATLTRELIDAAADCGGRYYLPYRLHATVEQFEKAYPQADAFFAAKRRFDPDDLFRNGFAAKYDASQPFP